MKKPEKDAKKKWALIYAEKVRAHRDVWRRTLRRERRYQRVVAENRLNRAGTPPVIVAPETFSIVDAPEEAAIFFDDLRTARFQAGARHVYAALSSVREVTQDALIALMAHRPYQGSLPTYAPAKQAVLDSGFTSFVRVNTNQAIRCTGRMHRRTHRDAVVDPTQAERISRLVNQLRGLPNEEEYTYEMLIECMSNTKTHAAGGKPRAEEWWLASNRRRNKICVAFVDIGLGILETAEQKGLLRGWMDGDTHPGRLREILAGRVASSTQRPERGLGLPGLVECARECPDIERLVIVANRAYVEALEGPDRDKTLEHPFRGTLIYWELK